MAGLMSAFLFFWRRAICWNERGYCAMKNWQALPEAICAFVVIRHPQHRSGCSTPLLSDFPYNRAVRIDKNNLANRRILKLCEDNAGDLRHLSLCDLLTLFSISILQRHKEHLSHLGVVNNPAIDIRLDFAHLFPGNIRKQLVNRQAVACDPGIICLLYTSDAADEL